MRDEHPGTTYSYTIPCSTAFRDRVIKLSESFDVSVADLARASLLILPEQAIDQFPDPGDPLHWDRELVTIMSGKGAGRRMRRKPRLQARLHTGLSVERIRKALAVFLSVKANQVVIANSDQDQRYEAEIIELGEENQRLRTLLRENMFRPLREGVRNRLEALYVFGFPPTDRPPQDLIKEEFRRLAKIHHPDGALGSHQRMTQLTQAMRILLEYA